ncbi:hypothetical protein [Candidatus Tisiphia endosymbiont of Ptychoptera albimana]|uniref:hypothetical protein n=1 Tax=Candidatus Tisiphia endosymbiont of Ptychoptera albimana TaxID=3066260 RepID=UPI001D1EF401|nr:hypothetical protein [Rickettsia endosymbiont of Sericostoma sp. HW-2014]
MNNRNAYIGKNVETLFKNSIIDRTDVVKTIQNVFAIDSRLVTAINSGIHNEKVDVKLEFACGRNIDASIKAYKKSVAYNQLTRTTLAIFCKKFNLDCIEYLQNLFIEKAKNSKTVKLFSIEEQERITSIFKPIIKEMIDWSMSYKKSREILVLYEREDSMMRIYSMTDILKHLDYTITFTSNGNLLVGKSIVIQRKGGNGHHIHGILNKTDPKHPGNNIQFKLRINTFVEEMKNYEIGKYYI